MDEDRIRDRAYAIWEREGHPEGRHEAHWEQARQELMDEERRERERAERDAPTAFDANVLSPDETLHPSGRNGGTLRPAAEAIGGLEGGGLEGGGREGGGPEAQPKARGRSRAPGGRDDSGGGA